MKIAFSTILLIIFSFKSDAQLPANCGNGAVQINLYRYVGLDTASLGTKDSRLFIEMHYFFCGQKILRSDSQRSISKDNQSGNGISNSLSVKISVPKYIIDLNTANSSFITESGLQAFYCDTPLSKNIFDVFYRKLLDINSLKVEIDTTKSRKVLVAGKECVEIKHRTKEGWRYLSYYKGDLNFQSPLNAFVPAFKYPILRIDVDLQDDPVDRYKTTGIARFEIERIDSSVQSPDLFKIPPGSKKIGYGEFKNKFFEQL